MAEGNYDHPSYITRQQTYVGITVAGNGGTSLPMTFPCSMRLRGIGYAVKTAGATAGAGLNALLLTGTVTTTLLAMTVGTAAANTMFTSTDPNASVPAGSLMYFQNGTDTANVGSVVIMHHLDAVLGTWAAP